MSASIDVILAIAFMASIFFVVVMLAALANDRERTWTTTMVLTNAQLEKAVYLCLLCVSDNVRLEIEDVIVLATFTCSRSQIARLKHVLVREKVIVGFQLINPSGFNIG